MKTKSTKRHLVVLALFLLSSGLPLQAVIQTMWFPQGLTSTFCGLNVVNLPLYTGTLKTVKPPLASPTPTYTCFLTPAWPPMKFTAGKFYTIEFPGGVWARIVSSASGGSTIKTSGLFGPPSLFPGPSSPFIIRQVMTIADVFDSAVDLQTGPLGIADEILMPNGDIFFNDGDDWRRKLYAPPLSPPKKILRFQGGQPIYFVQGFGFLRRGTGSLTVSVTGGVKSTPTWMQLNHPLVRLPTPQSAWSLLSTVTSTTRPVPPNPLFLPSSGLYTAVATTGLLSTNGTSAAEEVLIPMPFGELSTHSYFDDGAGTSGWFDVVTEVSSNAVALPAAVFITRQRASVLIKWNP